MEILPVGDIFNALVSQTRMIFGYGIFASVAIKLGFGLRNMLASGNKLKYYRLLSGMAPGFLRLPHHHVCCLLRVESGHSLEASPKIRVRLPSQPLIGASRQSLL